jgi:hypothetical protein
MSWYKSILNQPQLAAGELITLVYDFEYLYRDAGEPEGMALFQGETAPSGCTVYFSPGCVPRASYLIAGYGGTACETPMTENLRYLGGDMRFLDRLETNPARRMGPQP